MEQKITANKQIKEETTTNRQIDKMIDEWIDRHRWIRESN